MSKQHNDPDIIDSDEIHWDEAVTLHLSFEAMRRCADLILEDFNADDRPDYINRMLENLDNYLLDYDYRYELLADLTN